MNFLTSVTVFTRHTTSCAVINEVQSAPDDGLTTDFSCWRVTDTKYDVVIVKFAHGYPLVLPSFLVMFKSYQHFSVFQY